jgi:hypothetical protein
MPGGRIRGMTEPMEKLQGVLEFFKSANEILRGIGSPVKIWLLAIIFAIVVVWVVVAGILEFSKAAKEKHEGLLSMEKKFPRIFRFLYSGKVRFFLLVIVILLFAIDWRDTTTISPPSGVPKAPAVPTVTFVQQGDGTHTPKGPGWSWRVDVPYMKFKDDDPSIGIIVTAGREITSPTFEAECDVPCKFTATGMAFGPQGGFYGKPEWTEHSTKTRIQVLIPAKLDHGNVLWVTITGTDGKVPKVKSVKLL